MKIIIIGAGFTGMQLARALVAEQHRVVLIDRDAERVREIGNQLDCAVVHSEGNSLDVLERAGIEGADSLVAVAAADEVNMIACALADAVYPKVLKIARVRNYAYYIDTAGASRKYAAMFAGERRPPFGIDRMVNPDVEAAAAIARAAEHGAVGGIIALGRSYGIVTVPVGESSPLNGMPLWRLPAIEGWRFLVAHLETEGGAVLPGGSTVLHAGDRIGVLAKIDDFADVAALCDAATAPIARLAIVGAGNVGNLLVDNLLGGAHTRDGGAFRRGHPQVTVIDEAIERCRAISAAHRGIKVLCGDATDENLVHEEGLDSLDLVVAASENHERNLVTAAYMKMRGVARAIALTGNSSVAEMAARLGVDVAVPMRDTVVDSIMSHLRGRHVRSVHTVCGGALEIVECNVAEGSRAAGRPLCELEFPGSAIVLLMCTGDGESVVPRGDTIITARSTVILIVPAGTSDALSVFGA